MASPSKEESILQLILESSPLKEWHFGEIVAESKVSRAVANKWLKKYVKEGLLKRVKTQGRFPYITAGGNNPVYQSRKRLYALEMLHKSRLMQQLISLKSAKTVVIFGSIARGDWYKSSDIDIFIYGRAEGLNKGLYESRLKRSIEIHEFESRKELKEVKTGLLTNVLNGYLVKGQMQDITG
ncbi:nucleotidyltransferase domain-containing protein [Candidatus Woesearchaeota archaeon]|nr:nucleotidyltransferase domain-containing protein [Candidatus Woesearchaeota archaeon]